MGVAGTIANVLQRRAAPPPPPPEGGEEGGAEASGFDPADYTVAEVSAYVDAHPDEAAAIEAAERAGKSRVTLTDWFDARK